MYYAVYSKKQAKIGGKIVWSKPDGSRVIATEVSEDPNFVKSEWDDKEFLGEVVSFVERLSYGRLGPI